MLCGAPEIVYPEMWTNMIDPYFDPYGFISQWTEQILMDS